MGGPKKFFYFRISLLMEFLPVARYRIKTCILRFIFSFIIIFIATILPCYRQNFLRLKTEMFPTSITLYMCQLIDMTLSQYQPKSFELISWTLQVRAYLLQTDVQTDINTNRHAQTDSASFRMLQKFWQNEHILLQTPKYKENDKVIIEYISTALAFPMWFTL